MATCFTPAVLYRKNQGGTILCISTRDIAIVLLRTNISFLIRLAFHMYFKSRILIVIPRFYPRATVALQTLVVTAPFHSARSFATMRACKVFVTVVRLILSFIFTITITDFFFALHFGHVQQLYNSITYMQLFKLLPLQLPSNFIFHHRSCSSFFVFHHRSHSSFTSINYYS